MACNVFGDPFLEEVLDPYLRGVVHVRPSHHNDYMSSMTPRVILLEYYIYTMFLLVYALNF